MLANKFKLFVFMKCVLCTSLIFFTNTSCLQDDSVSVTQETDKDTQTVEADEIGSSKNVISSTDPSKEDLRDNYLNPSTITVMNSEIDDFD